MKRAFVVLMIAGLIVFCASAYADPPAEKILKAVVRYDRLSKDLLLRSGQNGKVMVW
jgi:hypothetical protein